MFHAVKLSRQFFLVLGAFMQIEFRGWGREVTTHVHNFLPVTSKKNLLVTEKAGAPMVWGPGHTAIGKIEKVSLTGSFLTTLKFEIKDVVAMLEAYAKEDPEGAIAVLSEIKTEAIINMIKKGQQKQPG